MEVWLAGTRAELDAAIRALTDVAYVSYVSQRRAMAGVDTGRYRVYLQLAVTTAPAPHRHAPSEGRGGALIHLDAARNRRSTTRKEMPGA